MTLHEWLAGWAGWSWALLANHLWQATIFAAIAYPAVLLLRRGPSRVRYAIWVIAGLKFAIPSALLALVIAAMGVDISARRPSSKQGADAFAAVSQLTVPINQSSSAVLDAPGSGGHSELFCVLTVAWLSGVAILLGLWMKQRRRLSHALKDGRRVTSGREMEALGRAGLLLGATRAVGLIVSAQIVEPGVWGSLRPSILLPEGMADDLSDAELEAVLLHELIHVARWDNLVSNLHMMLCCLFWFHPMTWIIDSRLLTERERACDDAVIRLGGRSEVYASSLLKVLRFCLGWKVAGVSYAGGSNLRRRVQRIMANDSDRKLRISHRVVLGAVAVLVVVFSIAAGVVNREQAVAQESVIQMGDIEPGAPDGTGNGSQQAKDINEVLRQAPDRAIAFSNEGGTPVSITQASVKWIKIVDERRKGDDGAVEPSVTYFMKPSLKLISNSERLIDAVAIELKAPDGRVKVYVERISYLLRPRDSFALNNRLVRFDGDPTSSVVKVIAVLFKDGTSWGDMPQPPPLPPPPPPPPRRAKADRPPPPLPPPPRPSKKAPPLPLHL